MNSTVESLPIFDSLTRSQKQAVFSKKGMMLVSAGAGSGKTKALSLRAYYLIKSGVKISSLFFTVSSNPHLIKVSTVLIFSTLSSFEGVADNSIKQLKIFKNRDGIYCCLANLMPYNTTADNWQLPYIICQEENFVELQKYMVSSESMYKDIIEANYSEIFDSGISLNDMYDFYQKKGQPWDSSLTIKLIDKYGATNDVLSLIEKTSDKNSVEAFIKKMNELNLLTTNDYDADSFEYRIIQLAAKVDATILRTKITINSIKL